MKNIIGFLDSFIIFYAINDGNKFLTMCCFARFSIPFVQFKTHEKHPSRILVKLQALLKVTILHGCFSYFLNCTNDTKSRSVTHLSKGARVQI